MNEPEAPRSSSMVARVRSTGRSWARSLAAALRRVADRLDRPRGAHTGTAAVHATATIPAISDAAGPVAASESAPQIELRAPVDYADLSKLKIETAAHLPLFPKLTEQLRGTSAHIESRVMDVCRSFQTIATRSRKHVDALGRRLGNQGEDEQESPRSEFSQLLDRTSDLLGTIISELEDAGRFMTTGADQVHSLHGEFDEIRIVLKRVLDIASGTKLLAVNSRIEASHAGEAGRGFAIVAEQMAGLSGKMRDTIESIESQLDRLDGDIDGTVERFRTNAEKSLERVGQLRPVVIDALANLSDGHETLREIISDSGHTNTEIARDINAAIVGLQFQDRAAQRIEHVVEAIDDFQSLLRGLMRGLDMGGPEIEQRRSEVEERIRRRYTMAEERDIDADVAAVDSAPTAAGGDDDDGVELF